MPKIEKPKVEGMLTVTYIREYLFMTKKLIHAWTKKTDIPAYRIGKYWMFENVKLETWVKSKNPSKVVLEEKIYE